MSKSKPFNFQFVFILQICFASRGHVTWVRVVGIYINIYIFTLIFAKIVNHFIINPSLFVIEMSHDDSLII